MKMQITDQSSVMKFISMLNVVLLRSNTPLQKQDLLTPEPIFQADLSMR